MVAEAAPLSALVPSLLLVWLLAAWSRDTRFVGTVWTTFVMGMVACIPVLFLAEPVGSALDRIEGRHLHALAQALLLAALPEEILKLAVLAGVLHFGGRIREPMHGLLFGAAGALGFASLENVLFASRSGLDTAILRFLTAVPCHAILGVLMGHFVARAVLHRRRPRRAWIAALLVPIAVHTLYDFPLFLTSPGRAAGDPLSGTVRWASAAMVLVVLLGGAALTLDMVHAAARQRSRSRPGEGLKALVLRPARLRAWLFVLVGCGLTSLGSWVLIGAVLSRMDAGSPLASFQSWWSALLAAGAFVVVGLVFFRRGLGRLRLQVRQALGAT